MAIYNLDLSTVTNTANFIRAKKHRSSGSVMLVTVRRSNEKREQIIEEQLQCACLIKATFALEINSLRLFNWENKHTCTFCTYCNNIMQLTKL